MKSESVGTVMVRTRNVACGARTASSRAMLLPSTKAVLVVIATVITRRSMAGSKPGKSATRAVWWMGA